MPTDAAPAGRARGVQISFTVTILTAFALLFLAVMAVTLLEMQRESRSAAAEAAERAVTGLADSTAARVQALAAPLHVAMATAAASLVPPRTVADPAREAVSLRQMLAALPQARAAVLAEPDGVLVQVVAADPTLRPTLGMPKGVAWASRVSNPGAASAWQFLDAAGSVTGQTAAAAEPDPREQIWYRTAANAAGPATTVVHLLPTLGRPGLAIVQRLSGAGAIGLFLTLDTIGTELLGRRASPHGIAFLMDDSGIILAHSDPTRAVVWTERDTVAWRALNGSPEPLDRALWLSYATGSFTPGRTLSLDVAGETWLARLAPVAGLGTPPALVVVAAPRADFTGPIARAERRTLATGIAGALLGLAAMAWIASRITRPLAGLSREAVAVGRLDLDAPLRVHSHITEVARLAGSMRSMKATLRSFGQYVPKDLVRRLAATGGVAKLGGERRVVTVMFTDIVGFTTLTDGMDAGHLMRLMSTYFEGAVQSLMADCATIDKFIGDAVMALWNAPTQNHAHAAHACRAALRCQRLCEGLERDFMARGWPGLSTRFGLNTGEVAVGNFGGSDRMAYTALGATVNMASRLEALNRHYGTTILVTSATRAAAGSGFVFRRVDRVMPKGRLEPTDIHELLGVARADEPRDVPLVVGADRIAQAAAWDGMVATYLDGRFEEAARRLGELDAVADGSALYSLYLTRIRAFRQQPPAADWNGVVAYQEK